MVIERGAARLVTGPLAFLLAGIIDLVVFSTQALRRSAAQRLTEARTQRGRAGR